MQHWAPPQYSEDGTWWWNGQRWIPVTWPIQQQYDWDQQQYDWPRRVQPRRRRTPAILWLGLIALVLLLVLAAGGGALGWVTRGLSGGGLGVAPTAPPTQAPAPAPSAAPSSIDDYRQAVVADAARFQSAGQAVADHCSPEALRSGTGDCQAALQTLDASVRTFQSDLDAHPAPSCLQPADRELRSSLGLYHQGAQQELDGLQRGDPLAVLRGASTLSDATAHAKVAASLLSAAC